MRFVITSNGTGADSAIFHKGIVNRLRKECDAVGWKTGDTYCECYCGVRRTSLDLDGVFGAVAHILDTCDSIRQRSGITGATIEFEVL